MGSSRSDKIALLPASWSDTLIHPYYEKIFTIFSFYELRFFVVVHLYWCIGPRGP